MHWEVGLCVVVLDVHVSAKHSELVTNQSFPRGRVFAFDWTESFALWWCRWETVEAHPYMSKRPRRGGLHNFDNSGTGLVAMRLSAGTRSCERSHPRNLREGFVALEASCVLLSLLSLSVVQWQLVLLNPTGGDCLTPCAPCWSVGTASPRPDGHSLSGTP